MIGDSIFKKIERKTNVNKETIMSLASTLQNSDMKDEKVLRQLISDISKVAGKDVDKEKADKIVNAIMKDKVPKNMEDII